MDPNVTETDKVKGIEILCFETVELTRNERGKNLFMDVGPLSVYFFPQYNRFLLYLNEWEYALLKRFPVTGSRNTEKSNAPYYTFPTYNGFYTLKLTKIPHPEGLENFETILRNSAKFSYEGEGYVVEAGEKSPDDSLVESYETFPEEEVTQPKVTQESSHAEEVKPGELHGMDKLKKGLAKFASKLSGGLSKQQINNINLTQVRDFETIKATSEGFVPSDYLWRKDVERAINKSKDIARKMSFGTIPSTSTTTQDIKKSEMMSESVQVTLHKIGETKELLTEDELRLAKEIERERQLQEESRHIQEEHRQKELHYVEKERELLDAVRKIQEQKALIELNYREQEIKTEIEQRDMSILEQERLRVSERLAFEEREKALVAELQRRLNELRAKERMTEEERAEFARREQELRTITQRKEAERFGAEQRHKELLESAKAGEAALRERERLTEAERKELERRERELEQEAQRIVEDLRRKDILTEEERAELKRREQELVRMSQLREAERIEMERRQKELQAEAQRKLAELREREKLSEAERAALERKDQEFRREAERRLAELRQKEKLTEAERLELKRREEELRMIAEVNKAQQEELRKKGQMLASEMERLEAELRERERFTSNEMMELERIKNQLLKQTEIKESERQELERKRQELLQEARMREEELKRREKMTEAERLDLSRKEEQIEKDLERRLAELREKERLTEEERIEFRRREQELHQLYKIKEVEVKKRKVQLDKLREHESQLMDKNKELIHGHLEMHQQIEKIGRELDKPMDEEVIKRNIAMSNEQAIREDISRVSGSRTDERKVERSGKEQSTQSHIEASQDVTHV